MKKLAWMLSACMLMTSVQVPVLASEGDEPDVTLLSEVNLADAGEVINETVEMKTNKVYYPMEDGYPFVFSLESSNLIGNGKYSDTALVSIDGGEKTPYKIENSRYQSLYLGILKGVSAGTHKIEVTVEYEAYGKKYIINGSSDFLFAENKGSEIHYQKEEPSYFSTKEGMKVQNVYISDLVVENDSARFKNISFVHSESGKVVWTKDYQGKEDNGYCNKSSDSRYNYEFEQVLPKNSWLLNKSIGTISWEGAIEEGYYDIVVESTDGRKHVLEKWYYGTDKPFAWRVSDAKDAINYGEGRTPIAADNRGSYVSVYVYGMNLNETTVPTFYSSEEEGKVISSYNTDDLICGNEAGEDVWGWFYTLKKGESPEWSLEGKKVPTATNVGESNTIQYKTKVANIINPKDFECSVNYAVMHDEYRVNKGEKSYRHICIADEWLAGSEAVKLTLEIWDKGKLESDELKVEKDINGSYVELPEESPLYEKWGDSGQKNIYKKTADGWQPAYSEGRYSYRNWNESHSDKGSLYLEKNLKFEIHPCNEVERILFKGTGAGLNKDVFTDDIRNSLIGKGMVRLCIYNEDGSLKKKDRIFVTEKTDKAPENTDNTGNNEDTNNGSNNDNSDIAPAPQAAKVGDKIKDSKTKATYKVTKSNGKSFEVELIAPSSKKNTSFTVPATIKDKNGFSFKVTAIAKNAFSKNNKLKSITVGKNIKSIGANAFSGCKNLKTITVKTTVLKSVGKNALKGINAKCKIKVPTGKLSAYKSLFKGKGQGKNVKIV